MLNHPPPIPPMMKSLLRNALAILFLAALAHQTLAQALFRPSNLPTGLQGYWKFNGNANDASPNAYHLSNVNTPGYAADDYWAALERHFIRHAQQVARFRRANRAVVRRMWKNQVNEDGEPLSQVERGALIERHCELFGTWPQL